MSFEVREGKAVWDGQTLEQWIAPLVAGLVSEFDPLEVVLFGSVARGDDDGDSDLDVLVVLDAYDPQDAIALKKRAARTAKAPVPFDACFTDPNRRTTRAPIAGTLERAARTEGHVIYKRSRISPSPYSSWAAPSA
ncbi:MAG: nucleotidyltransferase domain-containing protein [Acidimicrobiales bacterium]